MAAEVPAASAVRLPDFFANKGAWGSRYPHHDASTPAEALALCEQYDVPEAIVARLLGANAADLFGITNRPCQNATRSG